MIAVLCATDYSLDRAYKLVQHLASAHREVTIDAHVHSQRLQAPEEDVEEDSSALVSGLITVPVHRSSDLQCLRALHIFRTADE